MNNAISLYSSSEERVQKLAEGPLMTQEGLFSMVVYSAQEGKGDLIALVKGDVKDCKDPLVRIHSACITSESLRALDCDCAEQLHQAMSMIATEGKGVIVYLPQEGRGNGLAHKVQALRYTAAGLDTVDAFRALGLPDDIRDYRVAAEILRSLEIAGPVRLLTNNPRKVEQLNAHGIAVLSRVPLEIPTTTFTRKHLQAKRDKLNHLFHGSLEYIPTR
jgi:3,4-dihydroxy 2-butanone 4-phosphate synthase / GTP cyclohydrolase II